jgi:hypothetical protein
VPDAVEAVGQDVDQEPAHELRRLEPHDPLAVAGLDPVVLPAERDGVGVGADQTAVRDRDAVGVAAEIGKHGLGAAERGLGVVSETRLRHDDHPVSPAQRGEVRGEGRGIGQSRQIAEDLELSRRVQGRQPLEEQAAEQAGENPHRQEEPRARQAIHLLPSGDRPPPGTIMWMWGWWGHAGGVPSARRRAPGVQDRRHADPRAEAPGIRGDGHHGLGRGLEQEAVQGPPVPPGDPGDLRRQGEDEVEVLDRQKVLGPRGHPVTCRVRQCLSDHWRSIGSPWHFGQWRFLQEL